MECNECGISIIGEDTELCERCEACSQCLHFGSFNCEPDCEYLDF
jgi:hypothetical protein